jgi:hypothetical protein
MTAQRFNTLNYSNDLKSVGFTEKQAEKLAQLQEEILSNNDRELTTKTDLKELRVDIKQDIKDTKQEIKDFGIELRKEMLQFELKLRSYQSMILITSEGSM